MEVEPQQEEAEQSESSSMSNSPTAVREDVPLVQENVREKSKRARKLLQNSQNMRWLTLLYV